MKADIHPDYHKIKVVMTNGDEFETRSTWGKEGDTMRLDVDPHTHPAWNKGSHNIIESAGQIDKFKKRFGAFGAPGKKAAAPAAPAEAPKEEPKAEVKEQEAPKEEAKAEAAPAEEIKAEEAPAEEAKADEATSEDAAKDE